MQTHSHEASTGYHKKDSFTFLFHEKLLNGNLQYPIRIFSLEGLGINQQAFIDFFSPSFKKLQWDFYDVINEKIRLFKQAIPEKSAILDSIWNTSNTPEEAESFLSIFSKLIDKKDLATIEQILPYRKRAIATFILEHTNSWNLTRIPTGLFRQQKNKFNTQPRLFPEIESYLTDYNGFQMLLLNLAALIKSCRPGVQRIKVHCHQVSVKAYPNWPGKNSPEGIHQDGADYIVSALVLERRGIHGGISTVFGADQKTVYLNHCLNPGEGLFQADEGSPLYHVVSPIEATPPFGPYEHYRNLIGFDFKIIS